MRPVTRPLSPLFLTVFVSKATNWSRGSKVLDHVYESPKYRVGIRVVMSPILPTPRVSVVEEAVGAELLLYVGFIRVRVLVIQMEGLQLRRWRCGIIFGIFESGIGGSFDLAAC